jgi:cytochrome oxidase Cu insertion factor (SCO1/SenC/PrrC family)
MRAARRPLPWGAALLLLGLGASVWLVARPGQVLVGPGGGGPGGRAADGLDVFGQVPDFSLIERSGRRVSRADLLGRVWIATFIETP